MRITDKTGLTECQRGRHDLRIATLLDGRTITMCRRTGCAVRHPSPMPAYVPARRAPARRWNVTLSWPLLVVLAIAGVLLLSGCSTPAAEDPAPAPSPTSETLTESDVWITNYTKCLDDDTAQNMAATGDELRQLCNDVADSSTEKWKANQ